MKLGFGELLGKADLGLSQVSEFLHHHLQILPLIFLTGLISLSTQHPRQDCIVFVIPPWGSYLNYQIPLTYCPNMPGVFCLLLNPYHNGLFGLTELLYQMPENASGWIARTPSHILQIQALQIWPEEWIQTSWTNAAWEPIWLLATFYNL